MLVSSTESEAARSLGISSQRPEDFGADFWWIARKLMYGVQRKALGDLVASVEDGRLAKELLQMQVLDRAFLVIETGERGGGDPREMPDTTLAGLGKFGRAWTGGQYRGLVYSVIARGIAVLQTRDEEATIARVKEIEAWSRKAKHSSATTRGQVPRNVFGERKEREYGLWLLSSLPGVGSETAGKMWDHFGGLPFVMREGVGVKELCEVGGVGKVTAQRVLAVFGDGKVE